MTKIKRIREMLNGIITIILAIVMVIFPAEGAPVIVLLLCITFGIYGIQSLVYYFTMARYMVDGKLILFKGLLFFNAGLFMFDLLDIPLIYIMLYLLACHGFTGVLGVLRSLEARRMKVSWRSSFFVGIGNVIISILCLININSPNTMVYVFSFSLIANAISRIAGATKKTAMVYIQ